MKALLILGVIVLICVAGFHILANSPEEPRPPVFQEPREAGIEPAPLAVQPDRTPPAPSEFTAPIPVEEISDTGYLALVNGDHAVSDEPRFIVSAWPAVPVSTTEVTIHETALEAVSGLIAAAREVYDGTFYIGSGYRDAAAQSRIYNEASDKSLVQPPNHSEHHTGLAADIFIIGIGQHDMDGTDEARWLADNAWKYGLILRYPGSKRDITEIANEPWHFRYIGRLHAWYCFQNSLCFEEYIQFLKDGGGYTAELD